MSTRDWEELERRVRRISDIIEIQDLQSRYMYWLQFNRQDKILECFAQHSPTVSAEAGDSGVFLGFEAVKRHFSTGEKRGELGAYFEFCAENFVIEFSDDGQVAKGISFSPGLTSVASTGLLGWSYGKYDNDYIKEDGQWKIWHLRWRTTFQTPFDRGWLYQQAINSMRRHPLYPPESEITWYLPFNRYGVNYMVPEPPEARTLEVLLEQYG